MEKDRGHEASDHESVEEQQITVYQAVGGMEYFVALVGRFYDLVENDQTIRPLYPDDLSDARRHTALFLAQYWGGPPIYNAERGHPRLRMRHQPFAIGQVERDAWLGHMLEAIHAAQIHPQVESMFVNYFEQASTAMINQH